MRININAIIKSGGEVVSVLLDTSNEKIEEEKRVIKSMYPNDRITVVRKEGKNK